MDLNKTLQSVPVVPLVQADDPKVAVLTSRALAAGGLTVAEVVFRTDRALECLQAVAEEVPEMIAGAGTVLSPGQARAAIKAGARFIVSPGLDDGVVAVAKEHGIPVYPGIVTPSELQHAFNLGLEVVKFFPASLAGGVPMLKAFSSVFRSMRFMPTGGISAGNLAEYLAVPAVLACGGSWLTPAAAIFTGDYAQVTTLAIDAVKIAAQARRDGK
ncbi:MAG: bifunctional 4-hydroxy-2-oxoglutarate aldolase/2-dehydro-3-deoxy-phosphogluconate aldolase [Gammaproteobacteria bacterium]|nr:bifunctional 4-hydroxy-2-oxoglutarate aldolase/2-dehydro-3-deoxy-phosphogluconate aldolase [Gammaproteobacteria bacterium]MDH5304282.1 bifunctional 4-hydroxy-2-oxoglutarate aldolase/2-dehydro-3-deoxy-phosphogluconate aldolase [Gammaproteobacteria bacterium]MDH5321548.1 bifunctional 4-hydroxy-2-oxoglutarate aldolase/2-dehydro-3-deoxy-phosphogluconate aldolase [Gammaproteobacteria bacterium]